MVIDFHTHAFPEKVAARAMEKISRQTGGYVPVRDGTLGSLSSQSAEDGAKAVLLAIATNARQMHAVNDWAAQTMADENVVSAFGSVHPDAPDALEEIDRIADLGMKGVKLHPEYQAFDVEDPRMRPIYRRIARNGLITVFHSGLDPAYPPPCRLNAERLRAILPLFDGAPVVAAHMGGMMIWPDVLRMDAPDNLYIDTSFCFGRIDAPTANRLVERLGPERVLFGSDSPWDRASRVHRLVDALDISEADRRKIDYENAARLLRLEPQQ